MVCDVSREDDIKAVLADHWSTRLAALDIAVAIAGICF